MSVAFCHRMCVFCGLMVFSTGITAHAFSSILVGAVLIALFVDVRGPLFKIRPDKPAP